MSENPGFNPRLGSFTSGVDGSSEGGRINTMRLSNALSLFGVALVNKLKSDGYKAKLDFRPELVDGSWRLAVEYEGGEVPAVPEVWHGHRVAVRQKPAPPPQPPPAK